MPGAPRRGLLVDRIVPAQGFVRDMQVTADRGDTRRLPRCRRAQPVVKGQRRQLAPACAGPFMRDEKKREGITSARNGNPDRTARILAQSVKRGETGREPL